MVVTKNVKVYRSGNSLVVGIPADICRFMEIKDGGEMIMMPDFEKNTIVLIKKIPRTQLKLPKN